MFSVPAAIGVGVLPLDGIVVADVGSPLMTALLVAGLALVCGIFARLAVETRVPRIELRHTRVAQALLKRVA